jgi:hypothetical protein
MEIVQPVHIKDNAAIKKHIHVKVGKHERIALTLLVAMRPI